MAPPLVVEPQPQSERLYRDLLVVFTLTVVAEAGLARIGIEDLAIVFDQGDRTGSVDIRTVQVPVLGCRGAAEVVDGPLDVPAAKLPAADSREE